MAQKRRLGFDGQAAYALARERIFARTWQWIGDLADVAAPGALSPRELLPGLLDEPLLLARDAAGTLRCLSNVCTHRGNILVKAACKADQIRCGYHSRRFDLAGRMMFIPAFEHARDFPSRRDDLPELPLGSWGPLGFVSLAVVLTTGTLTAAMLRGAPFDKMIASVGATLLGVMYIGLLGGHLVATRTGFKEPLSAHLLSFFFMVLMGGDTAAYYVGRAVGKHKLAPRVSPGKTWEGAIGGMCASLLMAVLAHFWFFRELPLNWAVGLAAVMNILGVLGDLVESALKRGADAKDAASILPGHGGLLDRLDSLLFNAPLIYYFARIYFR